MSHATSCPRCEAPLDASGFEPGTQVSCPDCGGVFRVPAAEPPGAAPPPPSRSPVRRSRRGLTERRERTAAEAPPIEEVERRFAAARLCRSAFFLAIGSAVGYLLAGFLILPVAWVALVMGIVGLAKLAAVGKGRPLPQCEAGRERLAARMAKAARSRAWIAVGIGIGMTGLVAFQLWAAHEEQQRQREASERFVEDVREMLRPGGAPPGGPRGGR